MNTEGKNEVHDCAKLEGWILEEALDFIRREDPDPYFAHLLVGLYVDTARIFGFEESLDENHRLNQVKHVFMGEICKMVANPEYEPVSTRELLRQIGVYAT